MTQRNSGRDGNPRLDPAKVEYYRLAIGMSVKDLKIAAGLADETWRRVLRAEPIWMESAVKIQKALQVQSLLEILHPSILATLDGVETQCDSSDGLPDWEREAPLSGLVQAANGLKYYVWKLKHRLEDDRFARGKHYDLSLLPTKEQDRLRVYLSRHADICNRVGENGRFPLHLTTTPAPKGDGYWVIDEFTPGKTLSEMLPHAPIDPKLLPDLMRQVVEGLGALHQVQVIRRELSPEFIIVNDDGSVMLTDFELGKLLDSKPTVSSNWPASPYRAPEIGGRRLTEDDTHVDFYSWGRILLHAASGGLPSKGKETGEIESAAIPPRVRNILKRCLSLDPDQRPRQAKEVLQTLRGWK